MSTHMTETGTARLAEIAANLARHAYADPLPFDPERYRRAFLAAAAISVIEPDKVAREAMGDA